MIKLFTTAIPIWYLYATIIACICFSVGFVDGYTSVFLGV
jgi:hypothetical protein